MQTIYSIDYLNGLTMNELYKIAREYPHFSYSKIEKYLNANSNVVRETLKNNRTNSKLATEIRKSLIAYIHKAQIYNGDTAYDLYQKVLTRTRLNYTDIGRIIGCSPETVSRMINGNEANKRILDLKQYLTEVIEKHKPVKFTIEEIMEHNKKDWSHEAATMLYEKESTDNMLNKHNELLKAQQNKNPEFYNYLNSLTTIELCDLAKQYLNFSFAEMEQTLGISNGGVRQAARAKTSKFTSSIRAYLIDFLLEADASNYMPKEELNLKELFQEVEKYRHVTQSEIADAIGCAETTIYMCKLGKNKSKTAYQIKRYLESIINQYNSKTKDVKEEEQMSNDLNLEALFNEANNYQRITNKKIAEDLGLAVTTVSAAKTGKTNGKASLQIKEYLEAIVNQYKSLDEVIQKVQEQDLVQEESKEQEQMTEETFTEDKEMKTYDNFLNFIDTQKELPIVKKALEETLKENQNLDKILAKEEFITIETAQELNEKLFANEYTEEEILDFEKIYKAISAFDEFYHSENTQNTINNTKDTFVTGIAIASAKGQTFLNKGLNKFADFLNKSAEKIKNSNSDNKEE